MKHEQSRSDRPDSSEHRALLNRYFDAARTSDPLLSDEEIDAVAGGSAARRAVGSRRRPAWPVLGGLLLVAMLGVVLMIRTDSSTLPVAKREADTAQVVMVIAPGGGDTTFITLPPGEWQDTSAREPGGTADALRRLDILTPGDAELARIGVLRDEEGVWIGSRSKSGAIQGLHVGSNGTSFQPADDPKRWEGIVIPTWRPVLVTDEQGVWRVHEFDGDSIAPELARRERALPRNSRERFLLGRQIGRRAEELLAVRLDSLIPIMVTATGSGPGWSKGSERSIAVLWYERRPELRAALPLPAPAHPDASRTDDALPRPRSRAPIPPHGRAGRRGTDSINSKGTVEPRSANDDRRQDDPSSAPAREAPALDSLSITPNPVTEQARISFIVGAPTVVTIQIHDLHGEPLLTIPPIACATRGLWQVGFDAGALPPGMYIIRVRNTEGRAMIARFIVRAGTGS